MGLIRTTLQRLAASRLRALRERAAAPAASQARVLRRIVARAAGTRFGREHGLRSLRNLDDLRRAVPVRSYADMAPWWEPARRGEPDQSWPGVVRHWALSSGTTSGEKYLPVSTATIATNRGGGWDSLVPHLARGGDLFGGKLLFLGGCTTLRESGPVWIGDNTGIMARHLPWWARRWQAPHPAIAALPDWERKIQRAAAATLRDDIRMLCGVPSWLLLFADQVLRLARATAPGSRTLREVWPSLSLLVHGGVSFAPYRDRMAAVLGEGVATLDTWSASEGGMLAVQDQEHSADLLPLVDRGTVFELVPLAELGAANPTRLLLHEAETDVDYAVLLTTNSGLFGYLLGDVVRLVGHAPLRLRFAGRTAHTLNAFGEHVSGPELERAILAAARSVGAAVGEFAAAAVFPGNGAVTFGHRYYLELTPAPTLAALDGLADTIDRTLAAGNEDYATHRSHGVARPEVVPLPAGALLEWLGVRGRAGGQNKVPRVLTPELELDLRALIERRAWVRREVST